MVRAEEGGEAQQLGGLGNLSHLAEVEGPGGGHRVGVLASDRLGQHRQPPATVAPQVVLEAALVGGDVGADLLEGEGQAVARNLEELAEEVIEITNESLREAVETYRDAFGLAADLDLDVDTISYDVSVFALGAFGVSVFFLVNAIVGSLLTLSAPLLAFFLRDKIDDRIKERAREEGVKAIEGAGEKLEEELLRVIHDYGDRLKAFVETAGDKLYRQIEEALEQVQIETQGDVDRAELLTTVDERLASTRKVIGLIQKSREHLSKDAVEAGF